MVINTHCFQKRSKLLKVMSVRHTPLHRLPEVFLRIQLRRMGRQPLQLNTPFVLAQQPAHSLGVMSPVVVDKQAHVALGMSAQVEGTALLCLPSTATSAH
jgi:hypothetical protein